MIEVKNLTKTYKTGNKALKGINIQIQDGEFVFIMGRSGSGKSTLLKLLLKELEPTSGQIIVNDMDLEKMPRRYIPKYRRRLGMVFQDFRLLKDKTVYENVAFAQRVIGVSSREIKKNVPEMLRLVGLSSKYKAYPNQLSGGEQQRVAIARALINSPEILLADEPTGNLDVHNSMEIMELLEEINRRGTTVLVVTHSREIVAEMGKRVITLTRGVLTGDKKAVSGMKISILDLLHQGGHAQYHPEYLVFTGVGGDYFGMYFPVLYVFWLDCQRTVYGAECRIYSRNHGFLQ